MYHMIPDAVPLDVARSCIGIAIAWLIVGFFGCKLTAARMKRGDTVGRAAS